MMLFQQRAHGRIAEAVGLRAAEGSGLLLLRRVALTSTSWRLASSRARAA